MNTKEHWENVFSTKGEKEVSWYQQYPQTSVDFIEGLHLSKEAKIIDIGGGDSYLIDALLEKGYTNLYLLDIAAKAIERIQKRLGEKSKHVTFIVSDVLDYNPEISFDVWHDRASFHFLTEEKDIARYVEIVSNAVEEKGSLIIGTFSIDGSKKCSGLDITQYSEATLEEVFRNNFEKEKCMEVAHQTPFETIQNFVFCRFTKK
jgi:2-polyprenyl-3-methyl-5-hydroxy-6-metoxy-1,4-benzoquinol methylase